MVARFHGDRACPCPFARRREGRGGKEKKWSTIISGRDSGAHRVHNGFVEVPATGTFRSRSDRFEQAAPLCSAPQVKVASHRFRERLLIAVVPPFPSREASVSDDVSTARAASPDFPFFPPPPPAPLGARSARRGSHPRASKQRLRDASS